MKDKMDSSGDTTGGGDTQLNSIDANSCGDSLEIEMSTNEYTTTLKLAKCISNGNQNGNHCCEQTTCQGVLANYNEAMNVLGAKDDKIQELERHLEIILDENNLLQLEMQDMQSTVAVMDSIKDELEAFRKVNMDLKNYISASKSVAQELISMLETSQVDIKLVLAKLDSIISLTCLNSCDTMMTKLNSNNNKISEESGSTSQESQSAADTIIGELQIVEKPVADDVTNHIIISEESGSSSQENQSADTFGEVQIVEKPIAEDVANHIDMNLKVESLNTSSNLRRIKVKKGSIVPIRRSQRKSVIASQIKLELIPPPDSPDSRRKTHPASSYVGLSPNPTTTTSISYVIRTPVTSTTSISNIVSTAMSPTTSTSDMVIPAPLLTSTTTSNVIPIPISPSITTSNPTLIKSKRGRKKNPMNYHKPTDDTKKGLEVKCICGQTCSTRSALSSHIRLKVRGNIFKCSVCSIGFPRYDYLRRHMQIVHGLTLSSQRGQKAASITTIDKKQKVASITTVDKKKRAASITTIDKKKRAASITTVKKRAASITAVKKKAASITVKKKKSAAVTALVSGSKKIKGGGKREVHGVAKSKGSEFKCRCGVQFMREVTLHEHLRLKIGKRVFKCESCPASFARYDYFKEHMWREHELISTGMACRICGARGFPSHVELREHRLEFHDNNKSNTAQDAQDS